MILSCGKDHETAEILEAAKRAERRPVGRPRGIRCAACGKVPSRCRCGAQPVVAVLDAGPDVVGELGE